MLILIIGVFLFRRILGDFRKFLQHGAQFWSIIMPILCQNHEPLWKFLVIFVENN